MPERANEANYLRQISIVTAGKSYALGGMTAAEVSLASEAMRWSYVLRSRERWRDSAEVMARHQRDATATLNSFGLTDAMLHEIALAGRVVVTMPFEAERIGWGGRIFPWEFVLSRATRRYRTGAKSALTVMRHLKMGKPAPFRARTMSGRVLFVQSFPGALVQAYDARSECDRVRGAFGLAANDARWCALLNPTLDELRATCAGHRPDIVHITGCDTHQGLVLLRDEAGADAMVARNETVRSVGEWLREEAGVIDGCLLKRADGTPLMASPQELAQALTAGRAHQPYFVGLNLWNSAARVAPLLLPAGVLASMGFQDVFDDSLAEYFFERLYRSLVATQWRLPDAFEQAWAATRGQVDLVPGTGIALWARAPLIAPLNAPLTAPLTAPRSVAQAVAPAAASALVGATLAARSASVEVRIEPKKEINYAELHNQGDWSALHNQSTLFDRFELRGEVTNPPARVQVKVELNCGPESARYEAELVLDQERRSLKGLIKVPLTSMLMRTVSEALVSSLFVEVQCNDTVVHKNTYATRLLPVDQWLDNSTSGQWLPSFVLPRDPAVERAVMLAQRYVRVIRDDPGAGFEGYQSASVEDPASLDNVDLQVEAIWSALLHEWQLGYVNPPPTYNRALDSQRLRTPSAIYATRMGTCIDLALLFAACLELVDIHPVVFLLEGHALPGYWRHRDFQAAYRDVKLTGSMAPGDETRNAAPGAQRRPWREGKSGYREVCRLIRDGHLAPLETVRLTEHCGFREAREAGVQALQSAGDFDSIIDIAIAREHQVTPLPIVARTLPKEAAQGPVGERS